MKFFRERNPQWAEYALLEYESSVSTESGGNGSGPLKVKTFKSTGKFKDTPFPDGVQVKLKEQNPNTGTQWAWLKRKGFYVIQVMYDSRIGISPKEACTSRTHRESVGIYINGEFMIYRTPRCNEVENRITTIARQERAEQQAKRQVHTQSW